MSNITDVQVYPLKNPKGNLKANGSFVYGGALKVKFRLLSGQNGLFVSLPAQKGKDDTGADKWYPDVSILDKELQKELQTAVVNVFNKTSTNLMSQGKAPGPTNQDNIPF